MFETNTYRHLLEELDHKAVLVAVSKMHSVEDIRCAYDLGQRIFAENKAAELAAKAEVLPKDIEWHYIGHLQRNKVRTVLPYVSMIQSLDSMRLAQEIEKEAAKIGKVIPCLLEFHLAREDANKTGMNEEEGMELLKSCAAFPHIRICGMMAMGPHTDDAEKIYAVFQKGSELFRRLQKLDPKLNILSMGMSDDYPLAVKAGANMVRIGSRLFKGD